MACGSNMGEDKRDLEPMLDCTPSVCGTDGLTIIDEKEGPTFDK